MKKILFLLFATIFLTSCSSDDSSSTTSYIGAGSEYSITFDEDSETFDLTESDSSLSVSGSFTTLSTGFKKLTIGSVSGGGSEVPSVGDSGYGIDIPGVLFLLQPLEANTEIIGMVSKGSCPVGDFNMNWIITSIDRDDNFTDNCSADLSDPNVVGTDGLGTFSYTHSTGAGQLPALYDICGKDVNTNFSLGTITCSAGIDRHRLIPMQRWFNSQWWCCGCKTQDNQIIMALPVDTISSKADMADEYIGLVMVNGSSTSNVYTVKSTADTSGVFLSMKLILKPVILLLKIM